MNPERRTTHRESSARTSRFPVSSKATRLTLCTIICPSRAVTTLEIVNVEVYVFAPENAVQRVVTHVFTRLRDRATLQEAFDSDRPT
jgi:hypothetical protein